MYLDEKTADNIELIEQILNKNGLENIRYLTRLQSGSRSFSYYADDYIIRFPKAEIIWQTIKREKAVIDAIYPHLMPYFENKIHKIKLIDDTYPFSVSMRLYGKICDGKPESDYAVLYQNIKPIQQHKLAQNLAMFFHLMHQIDYTKLNIPKPTEVIDNWDVTLRDNFDYESARKALLPHKIDLNDYKPTSLNTEIALCHNDLSGSNLLLNPQSNDILAGIIDFGNTIVMPKYQDFYPLYKISRNLVTNVLNEYNKLTTSKIEQKQTDFMALCYIGYGLAINKDNPSPYLLKLLTLFL